MAVGNFASVSRFCWKFNEKFRLNLDNKIGRNILDVVANNLNPSGCCWGGGCTICFCFQFLLDGMINSIT